MHYKLDLHTHSTASPDGSITQQQYVQILKQGMLDYIAITDHNTLAFAIEMKKQLGDKIIVGEEIKTAQGDIIGLFLKQEIPKGLSLTKTIEHIKNQQGIVYIPHPFSTFRSSLANALIRHMPDIDIIEHFNPRNALLHENQKAHDLAKKYHKITAASSDAHCVSELGKTYSLISGIPAKESLYAVLKQARFMCSPTPFLHRLCPKKNVLQKRFFR